MYLQPLQLVNHSHVYVSGDVTIDPSAIIAPGVILQSSPDGRIIIGPGACLGMGTLLHAAHGTLEVEAGATLGVGTLFVGQGKIGANACLGAATTVYNASVNPNAVIPAGSLIGDTSRQVTIATETEKSVPIPQALTDNQAVTSPEQGALDQPDTEEKGMTTASTTEEDGSTMTVSSRSDSQTASSEDTASESESSSETPKRPAYGQVYVNQMLLTLFPNNQSVSYNHRNQK